MLNFLFVASELLYPKGKISPFSTATAETLCKGRDYIVSTMSCAL